MLKVAEPPILSGLMSYFTFAAASPYAKNFFKILQRIKETSLIHWPGLVEKERSTNYIEESNKIDPGDGIKLEHLFVILNFGYIVSLIIFVVERIVFKIGKSWKNHSYRYFKYHVNY